LIASSAFGSAPLRIPFTAPSTPIWPAVFSAVLRPGNEVQAA
jgi:hypothetical protein